MKVSDHKARCIGCSLSTPTPSLPTEGEGIAARRAAPGAILGWRNGTPEAPSMVERAGREMAAARGKPLTWTPFQS